MLTKIINVILGITIFTSLFLIGKNYFALEELRNIHNESKTYILNFLSQLPKKESKYLDTYIVHSGYLSNKDSFLELELDDKSIDKRDIPLFKTHLLLKPLDSIIGNDPLAEKWNENKSKIQKIFTEVSQLDDSLKRNLEKKNLEDVFKKNTISPEEWQKIILATTTSKSILSSRIGSFCSCFENHYSFLGIPSKTVVQVGDTIFIDWVNYFGGHVFIDQTYQVQSNYDKFHILETTYDNCKICDMQAETILLEEYQIPFSAIEKDEKWRSVFYFRNDKLEQDSVVLERELEF